MDTRAIAGIGVMLFTYALISWALGKYLNKKKEPKTSEFKNFLTGAWIIGLYHFKIKVSFLISGIMPIDFKEA